MKSITDIMELWPTTADFGRDIGLPYPTVASWKQRGSIPVAYWRGIIRAARRRGHAEVTGDLLIELHEHGVGDQPHGGFSEDAPPIEGEPTATVDAGAAGGHFSRWKHLRRSHFATTDEVVDHIRALRDEWDRR
jgi:hypothetical protein